MADNSRETEPGQALRVPDDDVETTHAGHPVAKVIAISLLVAVVTATIAIATLGDSLTVAARPTRWWMFVLIALGVGLAERYAFHVKYRRDAISFTTSEVAVALALAFMSPVSGTAVRVLVSVAVVWYTVRPPAYKLFFNTVSFSVETMVAYIIVRAIADPAASTDTRFLVGVAIALGIVPFLGTALVSVAIACFEGGLLRGFANSAKTGSMFNPVVAMVATVTVAAALVRPEMVVFAVVPVVALWFVLQQYGTLAQDHRDLTALHGFSGVVGGSIHLDELCQTAIREAARLLRSDSGSLQVFDRDGSVVASAGVGPAIRGLPANRDDVAWTKVFEMDEAVWCTVGVDGVLSLDQRGRNNMVAVPIRDADSVVGLLVVAERTGAGDSFGPEEFSRAYTLASQLASTLRRAILHARMEHDALHDALTGKANRLAFERAVDEAIGAGRADAVAVLMLDLNRFKEVNDTLGHHVGDRVLVEFAERVQSQLGLDDLLARFGGDEFAILVQREHIEDIRDLADRVLRDSFAPMRLDGLDVVVTASIGIAEITDDDAATVLRHADIAMYTAKREHTAVEMYRPEIDRRSPERLSILSGLREALDHGGLEVHYQPKVDMVTSTVTGAEALVRWNHPTRGWIPPIDFIQVAEESGLIKQLTDQVLTMAISATRRWCEQGYDLGISVNLSAHDLLDEQLPSRIETMLVEYGMPAERLTLEITETALLADTPRTTSTINRLNRLGVRLSLDDFGTGYSSLGYLRRLPVAELKVDQSFVKNLLFDEQDAVIVRSTIDLGHNLGLQVVAEGIENRATLDRLQDLGCDIGQGYGIARPLSSENFLTWLSTTEYRLPQKVLNKI